MKEASGFRFESPDLEQLKNIGHVCSLRSTELTSPPAVFSAYGKGMSTPTGYFGHNWDAFSDLLTDLYWIQDFHIFIVHDGAPRLPTENIEIYLDIVHTAAKTWETEPTGDLIGEIKFTPHTMQVYFPIETKVTISTHLEEYYLKYPSYDLR